MTIALLGGSSSGHESIIPGSLAISISSSQITPPTYRARCYVSGV
jgi:hypothetical protein